MYIHMSIDYTINIRGKKNEQIIHKQWNIHNDIQKNRNNQWAQTNKQITYITTKLN